MQHGELKNKKTKKKKPLKQNQYLSEYFESVNEVNFPRN